MPHSARQSAERHTVESINLRTQSRRLAGFFVGVLLSVLGISRGVAEFLTAEIRLAETGEIRPPRALDQGSLQVVCGGPRLDARPATEEEYRTHNWQGAPQLPTVWRRDQWQVEQGAPPGEITALCQTDDGYLWVGTANGLARFDGQRFIVLDERNTPTLTEITHDIRALKRGPQGELWVGTRTSVARFHSGRWETMGRSLLSDSDRLRDFSLAPDGTIWVASSRGLLGIRDGNWFTNGTPALFRIHGLGAVATDTSGTVWTGGPHGLIRWSPGSDRIDPVVPPDAGTSLIGTILPRPDDSCWALSPGVLRRVRTSVERAWTVPGGDFASAMLSPQKVAEGPGEVVWAPLGEREILHQAGHNGLKVIHDSEGRIVHRVRCLLRDREGNLWCGTRGEGLVRLRPQPVGSLEIRQPLGLEEATLVTEAHDGSIWCGLSGGAVAWSASGVIRYAFEFRPSYEVKTFAMAPAPDASAVWAGHLGRGLIALPMLGGAGFVTPFPWALRFGERAGNIRAIALAPTNGAWLGSTNGLHRYDGRGWTVFGPEQGLPSRDVRCLLWETNDDLWVGTFQGGLARLHRSSQGGSERRFEAWPLQAGPAPATVFALHHDRGGVLWIGTSHGLTCRLGTRDFDLPPVIPVLREGVLQILEDDAGWLWLSGRQGLVRVSREDILSLADGRDTPLRWSTLTTLEGMPSSQMGGESQPAGCRASDGRLYFPTARGVAVIDPTDPNLVLPPPRLLIEEVQGEAESLWTNGQPGTDVSGDRHNPSGESPPPSRLRPHHSRDLRIRYTTTSLSAADRVRFEHRLVGLDARWHAGGIEREARYTNLRPGRYRFEVRAINHQGTPSQEAASWEFLRVAAFHETVTFYVAVGLVVLGLAGGFTYWRLLWQRRVLRLEQQVALNQERQRIARDMHDDLGAQLSALSLRLSGTSTRDARESTEVQQRVREVLQHLHSLIWTVEPGNERLESLLGFVSDFAHDYLSRAGLQLRLSLPASASADIPLRPETRRHLIAAVKEGLRNVVQHAEATAVVIGISTADGRVVIEIADDGKGFESASTSRNGGLGHLAQRLADLGGTCQIESTPGKGTRLRLESPW